MEIASLKIREERFLSRDGDLLGDLIAL
jgi:hypothetical protein